MISLPCIVLHRASYGTAGGNQVPDSERDGLGVFPVSTLRTGRERECEDILRTGRDLYVDPDNGAETGMFRMKRVGNGKTSRPIPNERDT